MRQHDTNRVSATPASALVFGDATHTVSAFDAADSGERIVHLQRLRAHQASGFSYNLSGPNCLLRWARIPAGYSGPVDVVVHFHGYKGHNQMRLRDKAAASGLDLGTPGVARPTLGVVPHGHAFASSIAGTDGFDFPAIDTKAELMAFIDEVLAAFGSDGGPRATKGRVILTGHSGGGAALNKLMQSVGASGGVDAFQYFDATYGGRDTLTARNGWVETMISRDAAALGPMVDDAARRSHMQTHGGHLRIAFIDGTRRGTFAVGRAADQFMRERIDALASEPGIRAILCKFYRGQKVAQPNLTGHGLVPRACGGRLLADPGHDLAPEMQDLAAAPARTQAAADDEDWNNENVEAAAWDGEAFDVTVHELRAPARPADAPTGSAFITSLGERKGVERENRIFEQLRAGNIPGSMRSFHTVRASGNDRAGQRHEFEFYVLPDVLAVGSESDYVRMPTDPVTAQRIADLFGCLLPTARMVEQLYQAAPTKLPFIPGNYAGTPRAHLQDASSSYQWHSQQIDGQLRRPPTILTAGHKKELVISNSYLRAARNKTTGEMGPARPKLAFYGAYTAAGMPIQAPRNGTQVMRGFPSFAHEPVFVDYSHGVRLVWPTMKIDGAERRIAEVLRDSNLAPLIAAEGVINEPRYTLDRSGRPATAQAQAASSDDPLGLSWGPQDAGYGALGYGQSWDERIRTTVEGFLAGWMGIPVRVGTQTLRVHPPYFMNANAGSALATRERHRLATEHRAAAPAALRALIGESRFAHERIGKSTTQKLRDLLQDADSRGLLQADATVGSSPTADKLRDFLKHYGLGVDCSGFVAQAINKLIDLFPSATAADHIAAPYSTNSAALKGGQGAFERVTDPAHLCGGDTMWLSGHIRILAWTERRGGNICFCTAESRSSNPRDIGPSVAYWRLVPDSAAGSENFRGWRLERSNDLNAPDSAWARAGATHVYGHYRPLRRLLQAAGATPTALEADPAWSLQTGPQAVYGRAFTPQQGRFNCAPAGAFAVVPATFLPTPTRDAAAAIDAALTAAGLGAAQRGQIARAGLTPIAAVFGGPALGELFARLRWAPAFIVRQGSRANSMLVPRLLIHVVGHFRELARRAPSAAEAFVLECLGWAMMAHLRQAVEGATGQRWWLPPTPDFVTAVPNPMPAVGAEVRQLIMRLGFIDTVMPVGNWNVRYLAWRTGLPGRQWDSELNAAQPGLPLYASLLTVPAHVNTAASRTAFDNAWRQRLANTDAAHAPLAAGATQVTLAGLQNAAALRQCDNGNRHLPAGALGAVNLQGLELVQGFPALAGSARRVSRLTLLNQLHPVCTALFRAIRELGWNDLLFETEGSTCFRGVKHNPRVVVTVGGNPTTVSPFNAPTVQTVEHINNLASAAERSAVIAAARSARTLSDHGLGVAIDVNYPENVDNVAGRAFGSMDPRIVAIFEAFHFRWGACFSTTDPHHFDYCQAACAPAAAAATAAPPAGPLPGMIPSGAGSGGGGPMLA